MSPLLLNSKSITQIVFWSSTWIKSASSQAFPSFSLYITPIFLKGWSCSVFLDKKHPRPPPFSPLMLVKWVYIPSLIASRGFSCFLIRTQHWFEPVLARFSFQREPLVLILTIIFFLLQVWTWFFIFLNHVISILTHFSKIPKTINLLKKITHLLRFNLHYTLAKIAYCTSTKIYMKLKLGMHRQMVLRIIFKNQLLIKFSVLQHLVLERITLVLDP